MRCFREKNIPGPITGNYKIASLWGMRHAWWEATYAEPPARLRGGMASANALPVRALHNNSILFIFDSNALGYPCLHNFFIHLSKSD